MRKLYWSLYPIRSKRVVCKINSIPTDLFWSRIRKEEWEYSCLICKTFSEKTQGGSSNHWGYLETTTAELRACALSILKPFGSMTPSLSLKNWENVHHPLRSLNQKKGRSTGPIQWECRYRNCIAVTSPGNKQLSLQSTARFDVQCFRANGSSLSQSFRT